MIEFTCSECGKAIRVPDEHAGKQGRCACGAIMTIPSAPPAPPSPPPVWQAPAPVPFSAASSVQQPAKGMAICALVFGCLAIVIAPLGLVAAILGIIVLASRRAGKGMAAVGLVLGLVLPVVWIVFIPIALLPALGRSRELARQSVCMANLKSTSSAIETYKADNRSRTPRLDKYGDPAMAMDGTTADELFVDNAGTIETAIGHAGMQNVWLLIAKDLIPQDAFTCPSDPDHEERKETGPGSKCGWTSWRQIGYGLHYPYDADTEGGTENPAAWTDHLDGGVAILADKHPGSGESVTDTDGVYPGDDDDGTNQIKPSNHAKDGQAYLLCNGSVRFYKELDRAKGDRPKDSRCGKDGDDIYTAQNGAGTIPGQSADEDGNVINGELDTYIVPSSGSRP